MQSLQLHLSPFQHLRPRSHCSVFVQKRREKPLFCESVHTDLQKNATTTEVFENAPISTNGLRKTEAMSTHKNRCFSLRFVIRQMCVKAQKRRFFLLFCTKMEQCERVASMQQKRILTKMEQCERSLILS